MRTVCAVGLVFLAVTSLQAQDKWKVTTQNNPMDDQPIITAALTAEARIEGWLSKALPQLIVRCQKPANNLKLSPSLPVQPGLELYVVTGMPAHVENAEGKHMLRVRFDEAPPQTVGSSESTDKKALFLAPISATRWVVTHHTLADSHQMLVQFTPFNASPVIIKFDTRGFISHERAVLAACPAVDQSLWRWAPGQEPPKKGEGL